MRPEAIELDNQPTAGPAAIDLQPGHRAVDDRQRQTRPPAERQESQLEVGSCSAVAPVPLRRHRPQPGDTPPASSGSGLPKKLAPVRDPQPLGLAQKRPDAILVKPRCQVDHRSREGRRGEPFANREIGPIQPAASVNDDPTATPIRKAIPRGPVASIAMANDLHPGSRRHNTPDRRRAPVREGSMRSGCQQGSSPASPLSEHVVPDPVNALRHRYEGTTPDSLIHLLGSEAGLKQLLSADHSILLARQVQGEVGQGPCARPPRPALVTGRRIAPFRSSCSIHCRIVSGPDRHVWDVCNESATFDHLHSESTRNRPGPDPSTRPEDRLQLARVFVISD